MEVNQEQVVEVSQEQVVDIAQELNVSPTVVQTCIQQNAGRDAIIVIEDDSNNNDDNNNNNDDNDDDNSGNLSAETTNGQGVLTHTIPGKHLPNTGGTSLRNEVLFGGLLTLYGALMVYRLKRRG